MPHAKKANFELAAEFIMAIYPATKPNNPSHRVSAIKPSGAKKGKIRVGPKTGVKI
jgi:hypothetical protein